MLKRTLEVMVVTLAFLFAQGCATTQQADKGTSSPTAAVAQTFNVKDAPKDHFGVKNEGRPSVTYKQMYAPNWGGDVRQRVFYDGYDNAILAKYPESDEMKQYWERLLTLAPKKDLRQFGTSHFARWALVNEKWTVVEGNPGTTTAKPAAPTPAVQKTASANRLRISDITFNNKFTDAKKPKNGFFAAKWWKGEPQVMCYNEETQDNLPAATLEVILDHLSANRPQTAAELAHENFARREFSASSLTTATAKIAAATSPAPTADETAKLKAENAALQAKLTAKETAEAAKTPPAPAAQPKATVKKSAPVFSQAECVDKLKELGYEGNDGIKKFQKKHALTADGVAGSATCAQLRNVLAACTDCKDKAETK